MQALLTFILGVLTLLAVSLQRTYHDIPAKELKRRARDGDELAKLLYQVVGYGHSLRAVLWFLIVIAGGGFFLLLNRNAPAWFALAGSAALIWAAMVWLPAGRVTALGEWFAARMARPLAWLLNYLHPTIDRITAFIRRHRPLRFHTGLYEKDDLIELLEQQQVQADNRIERAELDLALAALTVGDKLVRGYLIPRRMVKMVSTEDTIGPVLMDELHQSGHSRFPVYEGEQDNVVGTLYMKDLVRAKQGGTVGKIMRDEVYYIHEEQSLVEALQAVLKTRHHLFVVVNDFEEYVGILTMEDVLEQIIGKPIVDEFDQYDDLRAVAAKTAQAEHKAHVTEAKTTPEPDKTIEI
jgi:CBS domain containing-hemolysin-like protein